MKPRSIKVVVPLLLFMAGAVAIAVLYRYLLFHETQLIRDSAVEHINAAGTGLAGMARYSLQRQDEEGLAMEVALLAPFPDLTLALVADGANKVLHATQSHWIELNVSDSPLGKAMTMADEVRASMSGQSREMDGGRSVVGVYAFHMPLHADNLQPQGTGIVLLGLDLTKRILDARQDALNIATASGGVLLLLTLLLWYALHRLVTEPVQRLVQTARAFTQGDYTASAGITEDNELGEISGALDTMGITALEREQAQATIMLRDRAIAEVDAGVIITDARKDDNPIVYVNPALEKMTGFTADEMLGQNPRFLQGNNSNQPELDIIRAGIRDEKPAQVVLRNYRKDGSEFLDEVSISPVRDVNNVVTHFIGVQSDVTERIATEARLLHSQKIDAIGQLSGGIAHDFNNLLSVVSGNLEFLRMELKSPELLEYVNDADAAANMGARLTRRLLAFSRQSELAPTIVDANTHVQNAIELLRSTIGETISLRLQLGESLWTTRADPGEIENSVVNLVINARDAMPGGGSILIKTSNASVESSRANAPAGLSRGDYVTISVSDNGTGMSDEVKSRIFEPFYTTKEEGKGTGLGLASIYGFAKQSGGHITVDTQPGVGTSMQLFLPRYSGQPVAPISASPSVI